MSTDVIAYRLSLFVSETSAADFQGQKKICWFIFGFFFFFFFFVETIGPTSTFCSLDLVNRCACPLHPSVNHASTLPFVLHLPRDQ